MELNLHIIAKTSGYSLLRRMSRRAQELCTIEWQHSPADDQFDYQDIPQKPRKAQLPCLGLTLKENVRT